MKRKIFGVAVFLIVGLLIWFLFIREYDYQISFKSNIASQGVFYEVKHWDSWGENKKAVEVIDDIVFENVKQRIIDDNESFILDWSFTQVNDSVTKVVVGIISEENKLKNRFHILTGSSNRVENVKQELIRFREELYDFSKKFVVEINGEVNMPDFKYAAVQGTSKRAEKAGEMISKNDRLVSIVKKDKKGDLPFVKIKSWDRDSDVIEFDFGFPIVEKGDSILLDSRLRTGNINPSKAIKATFYGNYKNSDQSWFAIMNYANKNNIDIVLQPLEMFYNNPMNGGNELDWKAEIFIPIKTH